MDNNNLLMIILAFVFGYCLQGMMKNMCGGRLVEGYDSCTAPWDECVELEPGGEDNQQCIYLYGKMGDCLSREYAYEQEAAKYAQMNMYY